jgi:type IV secretion system protein TrbI
MSQTLNASSVGPLPPDKPKRAVSKNIVFVIGGLILVVLLVGKVIADYRAGVFSEQPKQAERKAGDPADANAIKAAAKTGVDDSVVKRSMTQTQIDAAIAAPPELSASKAIEVAKASDSGAAAGAMSSVTGAAAPAEKTRSQTLDPNAATPDSLKVSSGKGATVAAASDRLRPTTQGSTASSDTASKMSDEALRLEQEAFSRRTSTIFAAGASGGSRSLRDTSTLDSSPSSGVRSPAAANANDDPVSAYINKLMAAAPGSAAGAAATGTQSAQLAWQQRQRSESTQEATFSNPAIPGKVLLPGNVIKLVTRTAIRSDLEAEVVAQVVEDVYDSIHGKTVIIPKGSTASGVASSVLTPGQERVLTAFRIVYFPDGRSFDFKGAAGAAADGAAGFEADVDRRLFRRYGTGLLLGAIAYAMDRRNPSNQVVIVNGNAAQQKQTLSDYAGQTLADTTKAYVEEQRQVPSLLTVPIGQEFIIPVKYPLVLVPTQPVKP